jgi:hypothetical protein
MLDVIHRLFSTKSQTAKRSRGRAFAHVGPLEDRVVLSAISFVPITHVAVNPQPLPPLAQVEFNPVGFPRLDAGSKEPTAINLNGIYRSSVLVSADPTHPPEPCIVDVIYNLSGSESVNFVPPGPTQAGTFSASFNLSGTEEVLIAFLSGSPDKPFWIFTGTVREQGMMSGAVSPPTSSVGNSPLTGEWQHTEVTLERGVSSNAPFASWSNQVQDSSTGTFSETFVPPGPTNVPSVSASFTQQDQFMQTLVPPGPPIIPAGAATSINGTFSASGTMTDTLLAAQTATTPQVDAGAVQYIDPS